MANDFYNGTRGSLYLLGTHRDVGNTSIAPAGRAEAIIRGKLLPEGTAFQGQHRKLRRGAGRPQPGVVSGAGHVAQFGVRTAVYRRWWLDPAPRSDAELQPAQSGRAADAVSAGNALSFHRFRPDGPQRDSVDELHRHRPRSKHLRCEFGAGSGLVHQPEYPLGAVFGQGYLLRIFSTQRHREHRVATPLALCQLELCVLCAEKPFTSLDKLMKPSLLPKILLLSLMLGSCQKLCSMNPRFSAILMPSRMSTWRRCCRVRCWACRFCTRTSTSALPTSGRAS